MDERKIDSLIAEKIMNWKVYKYKNIDTCEAIDEEGNIVVVGKEFSPSTKIQDAWMVAEKLPYDVKVTKYKELEPKYQAHVYVPGEVKTVFADTPSKAICLASLVAYEVDIIPRGDIKSLETSGWIIDVGDVFSNGYDEYHLKITKIILPENCNPDDATIHCVFVDPKDHSKVIDGTEDQHRAWYINECWFK